jgi:DNA-binding response OmpR family regulator
MLIDDDWNLHMVMKETLEDAGHELCSALNGEEGLVKVATEKPDILLLDVMMPGMNGFEICKRLRDEGRRIPIIFLSAKGDIVDKSIGFNIGGDDYVVKPFSTEELLLRIEAHLRRHKGDVAFSKAISRKGSTKIGDLEIIFNRYVVLLRGKPVDLTSKEFEILALMMANPGQVFSRNQIFEHIWGESSPSEENSITVFIRKIREKIEENPSEPRYLLTVWRVGYKFAEHV